MYARPKPSDPSSIRVPLTPILLLNRTLPLLCHYVCSRPLADILRNKNMSTKRSTTMLSDGKGQVARCRIASKIYIKKKKKRDMLKV